MGFDLSHLATGMIGAIGGVLSMLVGKRVRSADSDADRFVKLKNELIEELRAERDLLKDEVRRLRVDHARVERHEMALRIVVSELQRKDPENPALVHVEALLGAEFDLVAGAPPGSADMLREIDRRAAAEAGEEEK